MSRRQFLTWSLGAAGAALGGAAAARALQWQRRALVGFGTTLSIEAGDADPRRLAHALDQAVARLQDLEAMLSLYRADSAVSRLNRDGHLEEAPPDLTRLLEIAQAVAKASEGAFDVTVQPLWRAWADAQEQGRLPTPAELERARAKVGWRDLVVQGRRVRFLRPGMGITLNGIAQGFAADEVRAVLAANGIAHALVDAGEYAMRGHDPRGGRWLLGIADPRVDEAFVARLRADGRCVATSADNLTFFTPDFRHHHIFDPRTGDSPPALAGVTVAAAQGAVADALTKVFFVAGPERAAALARAWRVDALWIDKQGRWAATPGLDLARA